MDLGKEILVDHLIKRNCFWSFDGKSIDSIPDDMVIEKTLIYLDIEDINLLFKIYPTPLIKKIWKERLIPQGDYYDKLNKLLAWMYFDIKNPATYLKKSFNQHLKSLL